MAQVSDISQIWIKGARVGLVGLKQVFERVSAETPSCDSDLGDRLMELVGETNYIAEVARDDYRSALLKEYRRFLGMTIPDERSVMEIKVYGMGGCTRCGKLSEEILSTLAQLGIGADFEHVTDIDRFAELGPVAPPVVTVNGKLVSSGRVLTRAQIAHIIREESE